MEFSVIVVVFLSLAVQVYASHGASEAVSIPAKPANETSQSITANETTESRTSIVTSPQTTTPTTSTEQREAQIDPSQKSAYIPPPEDTSPVVVNIQPSAQQSAIIEQQEGQIGSPQTNQVSIPSITPNTEERQEAIMEKEIAMNRCDELKNTNTINYTDEQVRMYKAEMEEVCTPDPDIPHEGAIELPRETEEDRLNELILFKEILNSLSEEEREAALKFEGVTMEYLEKEIERLRNLATAKNNTNQEPITEETKKEEGGGFVSVVTNFVVSLIDNIFSIFR